MELQTQNLNSKDAAQDVRLTDLETNTLKAKAGYINSVDDIYNKADLDDRADIVNNALISIQGLARQADEQATANLTEINTLKPQVSANTANIATLTAGQSTNTTDIATNKANIATNTANITAVTTIANTAKATADTALAAGND